MALSSGQKLALVGAAGVGAFFLLSAGGGSAKAAGPVVDPCLSPADCATLQTCFNKVSATATAADLPKLKSFLDTAISLKCPSSLTDAITKKILDLGGGTPATGGGGGGGGTIPFNPSTIKNSQGLINDAWIIAKCKVPDDWASSHPSSVLADGTWSSLSAFASAGGVVSLDPAGGPETVHRSNNAIIRSLQSNAGISVDGSAGAQTAKAFSWGLSNGSPSGTGTSLGGEASVGALSSFGQRDCIAGIQAGWTDVWKNVPRSFQPSGSGSYRSGYNVGRNLATIIPQASLTPTISKTMLIKGLSLCLNRVGIPTYSKAVVESMASLGCACQGEGCESCGGQNATDFSSATVDADYAPGIAKLDRVFGNPMFGAKPRKFKRPFGQSSLFWPNAGTSGGTY